MPPGRARSVDGLLYIPADELLNEPALPRHCVPTVAPRGRRTLPLAAMTG